MGVGVHARASGSIGVSAFNVQIGGKSSTGVGINTAVQFGNICFSLGIPSFELGPHFNFGFGGSRGGAGGATGEDGGGGGGGSEGGGGGATGEDGGGGGGGSEGGGGGGGGGATGEDGGAVLVLVRRGARHFVAPSARPRPGGKRTVTCVDKE